MIEKHGEVDALHWKEVATPEPGPEEVRVRVESVGLNHLDIWVRKGVDGHHFPLPLIPGCDIAGKIDQFGPLNAQSRDQLEKQRIKEGSPVVIQPILSCGRCPACGRGEQALCRHFGIPGETRHGGCAEFVTVPIRNVVLRPPGVSAAHAASLPVAFVTAWQMLTRKCSLKPGDLVLIQAGGSGVSIAAIQIAKLFGATVITTVGDPGKVKKAKSLGADHVVEYRKKSFFEEVKKIAKDLGKSGADIALDHVGATTFNDSIRCLSWGGKLITCGATSGSEITIDLKAIFFKNISILGSTMGNLSDLPQIIDLVSQHKLRTVIDSTFKLEDLPKAHERLESRSIFGKVVLTN